MPQTTLTKADAGNTNKNNTAATRSRWILQTFLIGVMAFVFSLKTTNNIWFVGDTCTDSSVFKYVARVILQGGMPYRDTFDHKGPLIYLINALGMRISYWRGSWIFEFLALFIAFGFFYKIARLKCGRLAAFVVLLVSSSALFPFYEAENLTETYALPFISIALYIFLDYYLYDRVTKMRLLICGIGFGAVCMLRANMTGVWIVMSMGAVLLCVRERQFKKLGGMIALFVVGSCIVIVPILIWLINNQAFQAFVEDYILFNRMYLEATEKGSRAVTVAKTAFFFLNNTVNIMGTVIVGFRAFKNKKFCEWVYLIFLIINFLMVSMSGRNYLHYGLTLIPAMVYPFACLADGMSNKDSAGRGISVAVVIYFLSVVTIPGWITAADNAFQTYAGRNMLRFDEASMRVSQVVLDHTTEEDRIIVSGNWDMIYNYTKRFAASRYSYQSPPCKIDEQRMEEYLQEVENNKPKIAILIEDEADYSAMRELVSRNGYSEIMDEQIGGKKIHIYKAPDHNGQKAA